MPSSRFPSVRSTHLLYFQIKRLSRCDSLEIAYCALKAVTYCIRKLLVGIVGSTCPDLNFCAVCFVSACYIQAFVSKNLNRPPFEGPFLSVSPEISAGLYSDRRSIGVRRSCQAFGCIHLSSLESHGWLLNEEYVPLLRPGSRRSSPLKLDT